ncbi:MAG: ISKra4 family transposase [Sciscionella sp.]
MTRLARLAAETVNSGPPTSGQDGLTTLETAIRAAMTTIGARLLEDLLAAEAGYLGPRIDCGAGHHAVFAGYRAKRLDTVLGPLRLARGYYHCSACRRGVVPRDDQLGITAASLSPGLRTMIDTAAAAVPFAQAQSLLAELAGITLDTKRVERAAEADGLAAAAELAARTRAILSGRLVPPTPTAPEAGMLYLAVDGTGVPMTGAETAGRAGKGPDGRARTREAKLAALFTQTQTTEDGHPIRDPHSTSYLATLDPVETFTDLLDAAARQRGSQRIRQVVVLGDGARWIWNLADQRFPAATQIVDLYHAREHLHALADLLAFIIDDRGSWLTERLTELDNGNIEAISAAARTYQLDGPKAHELDVAVGYFEHNAHRMRYAHYRSLGMFVGSGVVEAGCKTVIGARLKRSGMHWTARGATAITTLRCTHASAQWTRTAA